MVNTIPPPNPVPVSPSPSEVLARLFPAPSSPPSTLAPGRLPNAGPGPTAALLKTLKDNHERSHVFFNYYSFHNHAAHHLLAIWSLGASGPLITAAYQDTHLDHMRTSFQAPDRVVISDENFHDYLGDENYYMGYLDYFHKVVLAPGATISSILEKYIFSSEYNINTSLAPGKQQPEMLNRFVEILIHPLIHTGYAAEFGLPGMLAEGLSQASVHPARATILVSRLLFSGQGISLNEPKPHVHALTILSQMLADKRFWTRILEKHEFEAMLVSHGELINSYGEMWTCEVNSQDDFKRHFEELVWASTLMYGVSSWVGESEEYSADFFTMHIVTSCLFLPSLCAHLSYRSQSLLLRAHFLASITWWLVRGRPAFPLRKFFAAPLAPLASPGHFKYATTIPGVLPQPAACALDRDSPHAVTPNPWLPLLQNTIVHPNEHLCKCQRSLAHFALLYGHRDAGFISETLSSDPAIAFPDTPVAPGGLELAEEDYAAFDTPEWEFLDGSLFLRVAWLTGAALGWVRDGEPNSGVWDYQEFEKLAVERDELEASMKANDGSTTSGTK